MKKKRLTKKWAASALILGMLALLIAACGPAETIPASEAGEMGGGHETSAESGSETNAVTTESGLQYVEVEAGTGPAPQTGDLVKVHYTGTLDDGTEFDSSAGGDPIEFPLGQGFVIPGWEEGIAMMKEGGKAQLIIPPELAYGDQERPGIPANSTLHFDVELVSVSPPPATEEPVPAEPPTEVAEEDFTTTDSGLKYAVLSEGSGDKPQNGEIVAVHFTGWLADGTNFGGSEGGPPVEFAVGNNEILPGWDEAVLLMQEGEKAQFIMPPELAFGAEGIPGLVPPDETVTFEMELVSISPPPPTPTPAPPPATVSEDEYMVTDSGLKIAVLEEGSGDSPQAGDTVSVHYRLWLEDGTQIDSSYDRGQPFPFTMGTNSTIPGWEEGVALMKVGEKAQLVLPPELAYGEQGIGPIPPNATLIFEVELLEIQPGQ